MATLQDAVAAAVFEGTHRAPDDNARVARGDADLATCRYSISSSPTCGSLSIDEVHALAGTDRGAHLMSVIERLARLSKHDLQRVGLSATVGNPDAILQWLKGTSVRTGSLSTRLNSQHHGNFSSFTTLT